MARPRKTTVTPTAPSGALTVKAANSISDGNGGYFPVGHRFDAEKDTAESLKAKGLAE